ncbi:MAG: MFS transporter [Eudoraea sp.]|nr:MFS transporter [Maribacter sp.]NNE01744.1 MFS transporter [Eudoraea sp.]
MKKHTWVLPVIIISQFCCTSLWFACNGVMPDLVASFDLSDRALGHLTSAVQFGFISGTLLFALFTIADRFSPSKVFLISAILGGLFNLTMLWGNNTIVSLLIFRYLTGFFLAGIYPVGMKIAADYFKEGLGKSLGYLVGALVLGTALPHLIKDTLGGTSWNSVVIFTTCLATFGGVLIALLVPDGPHRMAKLQLDPKSLYQVFLNKPFRSAAFGYFGHMWELYAFWAFVPIMLTTYSNLSTTSSLNIPLWSFLIIGVGGIGCVMGGYISQWFGVKSTASTALLLSLGCCLFSPWAFGFQSDFLFLAFLLFWGMVVIADSPLFSTLVANNASPEVKGTALTIVNCIGFSITIVSIQMLTWLQEIMDPTLIYVFLMIGPLLGLIALRNKRKNGDELHTKIFK